MDVTGGGELAAIERLRRLLPEAPAGETWLGDDAAVLGGGLLLAIDTVVEGVDFEDLETAGWKAVVANVSDIAAMGGDPHHLVVSVAGPPGTDLDSLYRGVLAAAEAHGCAVVGGDLSAAPTVVVTVAITGVLDGPAVLRSGARPGDVVYVTGPLGEAAASGYRARRVARVAEGQAARAAGATAMIDVSDGLGLDLCRLARASGVGLALEDVPVAEGATREQALGGGEDFELAFALPPAAMPPPGSLRIGVCTADPSQLPEASGWEHSL